MEITSLTNAKVKEWNKLHQKKYRDEQQLYLVEGKHLIDEAIKADALESLIVTQESLPTFTFKNTYIVTESIMKKLSTQTSIASCMGVCRKPVSLFAPKQRVLLLDDIQDPGNMGTLIRSAYSFGYEAVAASKNSVDFYNEKTIQATQGACFHIALSNMDLLETIVQLKMEGFMVYALSLHDALPLTSFAKPEKLAILVGNEANGIHENLIEACSASIKIEMTHFESLNAAVAGSIGMHYFQI